MFKKTKNFLVLALLAAAAITWAPQARAAQENPGEIVDASAHTGAIKQQEEGVNPENIQELKEEEFFAENPAALWRALKEAAKTVSTNALVACGLYKCLNYAITVPHELGHAFALSTLLPGSLDSVKFLPHTIKVGVRLSKRRTITTGGAVYWHYSDSSASDVSFKISKSLVGVAGPAAGVAAALSLGKLSKHKKCPEWVKWPLRVVSCLLAVDQLCNLIPDRNLATDGGKIFDTWIGKGGNSRERRLIAGLSEIALYGVIPYVVHREFPNFFRKVKEDIKDFHDL
jgi:hypothetical protein